VLVGEKGPEVMPAAEMLYVDYPEDKPRILNFASKWDEDSFEYHNTIRSFELSKADMRLVKKMNEISLKCFELFEMNGYARVDFRVDAENRPYVLEVNANPCIAPDAGFAAACRQGGLSYNEMINRIIKAVQ
jgi:D-alanine-D-alanine ligase